MKIPSVSSYSYVLTPFQKQNYMNNRVNFERSCTIDTFESTSNSAKCCLNDLSSVLSSEDLNSDKLLKVFGKIEKLSDTDKKKFISLYCQETGFPDMQQTSKLIVTDVKNALLTAQQKTGVEVLLAGYNPTCSAANGHALPGSDFDTLFICLKDWDNFNNFKSEFKRNVNPLLCSMNRRRTDDMPDFVIIDDITSSIHMAQTEFDNNGLNENSSMYDSILNEQIQDWTLAGKYNRDLNEYIPDKDKTPLLRAGLLMEILRDGEVLVDNLDGETEGKLKDSCVYKYSNMQQMRSFKNAPLKNKHKNREKILSGFNELDDNEKLNLILNVIMISVKDLKNSVEEKYKPMFKDAGCGNMEDLIQPLLSNEHRQDFYKDKK